MLLTGCEDALFYQNQTSFWTNHRDDLRELGMTTHPIELTRLDSATFEHLVNTLAMKVLGMGVTGFAPGADGGRDGYFEGEAEYPSAVDRWDGIWYIQSKFRAPSLAGNPQAWLQQQVKDELAEFGHPGSGRVIPDNWIIATNVDPSGTPGKGTFDKIRATISAFNPKLAKRTHIWGGRKLLDLLVIHGEIARHYGGLLTSGDVIAKIINSISDSSASIDAIMRHLVVAQLSEQQYTRLEQAGSSSDTRPGIQTLYTDLPFEFSQTRHPAILAELSRTVAEIHTPSPIDFGLQWQLWRRRPSRSRVCFIRGGPGNGKSTVTQFLCQVQRAALLDTSIKMTVPEKVRDLVGDIKERAKKSGYWPLSPRVPIHVELRLYAKWYGEQSRNSPCGVLSYLAARLQKDLEQAVLVATLRRAFAQGRWLFVFDGLDEVPGDVKDLVANEIRKFSDETLYDCTADALILCTSRPQGYSGQFDEMRPTILDLAKLSPQEALARADPVLRIDRSKDEIEHYRSTLKDAILSPSIREIMTTPLQTHIMAVVVRDGGRPPDRKWQLFSNFYQVIKKREANRNLADPKISKLLREGDKLIKALHNRLGFELHYRAEKSSGAQTSISRPEFREIISEIVHSLQEDDIDRTITLLDEATTERLVLVNTPEDGNAVRFDIRPLQEFFAAEYLYESAIEGGFLERLRAIASDSHWREVLHFLLSALVEQSRRGELAQAIQVLSELDDNPPDQRRSFARRLCIGGIIAIRLLSEGVIESDRRTRMSFRKCIHSLLASTDARSFLFSSPPPHSASWLSTVALDTIAEGVPCENIGAACILPLTLAETYENVERAIANLVDCDKSYLDVFIDYRWFIERNDEEGTPPLWVFTALLKRVLAPNWRELGEETLDKIYQVFASDPKSLSESAVGLGIPKDLADNLFRFFVVHHFVEKFTDDKVVTNVGGALIKFRKKKKSEFGVIITNIELMQKFQEIGGVIGACALLAVTAVQPTPEGYNQVEGSIGGVEGIHLLPTQVRSALIERSIVESRDKKISDFLKKGNFDEIDYEIVRDYHGEINWEDILSELPWFCLNLLRSDGIEKLTESLEKWLKDKGNRTIFLDKLEGMDDYGSMWLGDLGEIVEKFPENSQDFKRLYARKIVASPAIYFGDRGKSFEFVLPDDADLLPHLVGYLISDHRSLSDSPRFEHTSEVAYFSHAKRFLPDFSRLEPIWQGATFSREAVAAAGALLILNLPSSMSKIEQEKFFERLLELYDPEYSFWFMPGVLRFLSAEIKNRDESALDFVDQLLARAQTDLLGRKACEDVIASWREMSHAPVHSTLSSGIWSSHI